MDHVLKGLSLPDRFEALTSKLGADIAQVLVPPTSDAHQKLERASLSIGTRGEGLFIPVFGKPGAGKTTFSNSLFHFFPTSYRPTAQHNGLVTFDALHATALEALKDRLANDTRVLPMLLDHRERNPASDEELASIKRFLRTSALGVQPLILWPETDDSNARSMADRFVAISGASPIDLPLTFFGPDRAAWTDIAINTLKVANSVEHLEELGVDPKTYDVEQFQSLGDFLRRISTDFDNRRFQLLQETRKPITLIVAFCSETQDPGVLTQLTSAGRYGLADAQALVGVTPTSELGKWWQRRKGLLTRAIIQLNIHLFSIPPGVSMGVLRRNGPEEIKRLLDGVGVKTPGLTRLNRDISRADIGKFLRGESIRAYEARGTPAGISVQGFRKIGERGFTLGRDKELNKAFRAAWKDYFSDAEISCEAVECEKKLSFVNLVPDTAIQTANEAICIEYHWRSGDFLRPANRADVSTYVLRKARDYVRQLEWTTD